MNFTKCYFCQNNSINYYEAINDEISDLYNQLKWANKNKKEKIFKRIKELQDLLKEKEELELN